MKEQPAGPDSYPDTGANGEPVYREPAGRAANPCDMGQMCLNCQPRGPNGECPDMPLSTDKATHDALESVPRDEPVAYLMTDVRNGRKHLTFDYGDHGMHDAITKLHTRPFDPQEAMRLADEYARSHWRTEVEDRAALARYLEAK